MDSFYDLVRRYHTDRECAAEQHRLAERAQHPNPDVSSARRSQHRLPRAWLVLALLLFLTAVPPVTTSAAATLPVAALETMTQDVYPRTDAPVQVARGQSVVSVWPLKTLPTARGTDAVADRLIAIFKETPTALVLDEALQHAATVGAGPATPPLQVGPRSYLIDVSVPGGLPPIQVGPGTGLSTGSYDYRVRACDSAGCSNWSNQVTGYIGSPKLSVSLEIRIDPGIAICSMRAARCVVWPTAV